MKTEISMGRYACSLGLAFVCLCGFAALLSSCERDLPGGAPGKSGKIELRFTLGDLSYSGSGTETRAYGAEPETVVVPLGGDLYLYATLEPDQESRLREATPEFIQPNVLVKIAAYNSDGAFVDSAEYKVTYDNKFNQVLIPTAASGRGLSVPTAGEYNFVAYSYNNTTSPPTPLNSSVEVTCEGGKNDLIWGIKQKQTVSEGTKNIEIGNMKHKFSQVSIKITSPSSSHKIDAVPTATLSPVPKCSLSLSGGALNGSDIDIQSAVSFTFKEKGIGTEGKDTVLSNPSYVFTNGKAFTIELTNVKINNVPQKTTLSAIFSKTPLEGGKAYTLSLKLKNIEFAASNIYWVSQGPDTGYLTFDTVPSGNNNRYQGVFFKFGSLVGISPAQTVGAGDYGNDFNSSTIIYIPTYKRTNDTKTWVSKPASYKGWGWPDIPSYGDVASTGTNDRKDDSVININYNSADNWEAWKGDICRFIDKNYRLPLSDEFGTGTWTFSRTSLSGGFNSVAESDGKKVMDAYTASQTSITPTVFPANGCRDADGKLVNVLLQTYLYSGSAISLPQYSYAGCYYFTWSGGSGNHGQENRRNQGLAVRCVKK